jgi:hypothetical protein
MKMAEVTKRAIHADRSYGRCLLFCASAVVTAAIVLLLAGVVPAAKDGLVKVLRWALS